MRYFRCLSLAIALLFCITAVNPPISVLAKSDTAQKKTQSSKKDAASSSKSAQKDDSDRALWQKRARESSALTGKASWYGKDFHNKLTASGLEYDMYTFTAAHRTLPLGTVVKVTDANNGKSVMVCVTDRGPFIKGRIIDLSLAAARRIGIEDKGVGSVNLEVVSDETGAPLKADQAYFVRYAAGTGKKKIGPFGGFADAEAMREALGKAHPEAEVIIESASMQK